MSGVALLVWKNGETIMAAVIDRGHKVRRKRMKDQDRSSWIKYRLGNCDSLDFGVMFIV